MRRLPSLLLSLALSAAQAAPLSEPTAAAAARLPRRTSDEPALQKPSVEVSDVEEEEEEEEPAPGTPQAKHKEEVEADPLRSTISHQHWLSNFVSSHRPEWVQGSFDVMGVTDWVDQKLCWTFNWACPEPPAFFDSDWGHVYFWMLIFANIFVMLLLVSTLGGLISHLLDPMPRTLREKRAELSQRGVTVLLPCYLPNEHEIMWSTIAHIIEKIEYEYPYTVICCYNTPKYMPIEDTLAKVDGTVYPNGRRLKVVKVEGSSSKAENLNAALALVETENVVIYDADHHPDPESLLVASAALEAHGASCIQGSTYLRTRPNMLAAYINAEFFVTHFVFFPAMQFITQMGVFGGSNALWRTDDLRAYQFRADVQTEDIDLSTRALLGGKVSIRFEPRCRSGELPPATFSALYRQRLRWALGWDQVTLQHFSTIWSARLGCLQKLGLYYILPLRWGVLLSATLNALLTPIVATWYFQTTGGPLGKPIESCIFLSLSAFLVCCVVVATNAVLYEPPRRWPAVCLFQISGLLYIGWQVLLVIVSLSKICTGADGGWIVTQRLPSKQQASNPASPHRPSSQPPSPIAAAFQSVRDADMKVPDSLGRTSPEPMRATGRLKWFDGFANGDGANGQHSNAKQQPWYENPSNLLMA